MQKIIQSSVYILTTGFLSACGGGDSNAPSSVLGALTERTVYGLESRPANTSCSAENFNFGSSSIKLQRVFPQLSFNQALILAQLPGDSSRWLVGQRQGQISMFDHTGTSATLFADLTSRISSGGSEQGLLGLAFHPAYPATAEIYLSYINLQNKSVISRFTVNIDTNQLNTDSETILLTLHQPYFNHNGGHIAFGPDGYLYIGFGDGGDGGDPENNAQNTESLLGSMLRIDVNNSLYSIPPDNPFAANNACGTNSSCPEIWAWGLRNPWRWSFDSGTGKLWLGDVGQSAREEIDIIERNKNYGWRCFEGNNDYNNSGCQSAENYQMPVAEYDHTEGFSVTGGYVYRGSALPGLTGTYLYGDFASGHVWGIDSTKPERGVTRLIDGSGLNISSFAEGADKELYMLDFYGGGIYKIVEGDDTGSSTQTHLLSENGCMQADNPTEPASGVIPYTVNAPLWSDSSGKNRWLAIPDNSRITTDSAGDWVFPNGSVLIKDFYLNSKPVETRFLVRNSDSAWQGYSYAWNEEGTDAELLTENETHTIANQQWNFPVDQCFQCHTQAAGIALGPENIQINGTMTYPSTGIDANQLDTLEKIGILKTNNGYNPHIAPALSDWKNSELTLEERARSYLHANCSGCHQPESTGRGLLDFRYQTSIADMQACDQNANFGAAGSLAGKLINPGYGGDSVMVKRMASKDSSNRMPPVGSTIIDDTGVKLISDWIDSIAQCP